MRIEHGVLEDVKSVNLAEYMMRDGVKLKPQRSGSYLGHCPFHEDSSPSLSVNLKGRTWLWHCFGCGAGGDVVKYVMKRENLSFAGALEKLSFATEALAKEEGAGLDERPGLAAHSVTQESSGPASAPTDSVTKTSADELGEGRVSKIISRCAAYYHEILKENKPAQEYLKKRGLLASELIDRYKIGFCDGSLPKDAEVRGELEAIGILGRQGYEHFYNCVVFPIETSNGALVSMYGRHIYQKRHLYLPGPHRGVFNAGYVKNAKRIFLTEGIIDALSLIQLGIHETAALYGTNGFTPEHEEMLANPDLEEVYFCLDGDEAGKGAVAGLVGKLSDKGLRFFRMNWPENVKDANDFLLSGKTKEDLLSRVEEIMPEKTLFSNESQATGFEVKESDSEILFRNCAVSYRIRGLNVQRVDTLKVTLKMENPEGYHLDTLDLYSARQRQDFVRQAKKLIGATEGDVLRDLRMITDRLELIRSKMLEAGSKQEDFQMSTQEKLEALEILRSPDLIERILEDAKASAYVGEEKNFLLGYLVSISRKLKNPLAILVISQSGAGKTELQDRVMTFTPPEDYLKLTRLTDQSLFYQEKDALVHKLVAIEEEEGAQGAGYSIRHLLSTNVLTTMTTVKDELTGKMRAMSHEVKGPISMMITTTNSEINFETYNRFLIVTVNESREQTRKILEIQRHLETLEGVVARRHHEKIARREQNMQRLLEPLEVVNPYAERLAFMDSLLRARREQKKYHNLIKAIALLRQHQKQVKIGKDGEDSFKYIEVDKRDIDLANDLAKEFLLRGLDEMTPVTRKFARKIKELEGELLKKVEGEEEVLMSVREIREHIGWSDYAIRKCVAELVRLEYLIPVKVEKGRLIRYQLLWDGLEPKAEDLGLRDPKDF